MSQFCALVVEQAITFLDNLASLDSPSSSQVSTKEIFERKSQILPNSVIGRHLRYFSPFLREYYLLEEDVCIDE